MISLALIGAWIWERRSFLQSCNQQEHPRWLIIDVKLRCRLFNLCNCPEQGHCAMLPSRASFQRNGYWNIKRRRQTMKRMWNFFACLIFLQDIVHQSRMLTSCSSKHCFDERTNEHFRSSRDEKKLFLLFNNNSRNRTHILLLLLSFHPIALALFRELEHVSLLQQRTNHYSSAEMKRIFHLLPSKKITSAGWIKK